jgi:hypothetical protein
MPEVDERLSAPEGAEATDFCVIWEPKATVDALIASLGITGLTTSTKADGSVKVVGANTCVYVSQRGINMGCVGEDTYLVSSVD